MLFVFDPIGTFFGAKSRYQKQQLAVAQEQLAVAATQKIIAEDQLALSCAPVEERAALLQARIERRRREAQNVAVTKFIGGAVMFVMLAIAFISMSQRSATTPAQAHSTPASSPAPTPTSSSYQHGWEDRQGWETWFRATSGQYRSGALWWSGRRSLANHGVCASLKGDAVAGCDAAKAKLDPTDSLRNSDADYRLGWNNWTVGQTAAPASAAVPTSVVKTASQEITGCSQAELDEEPDHSKLSRCAWAHKGYHSWQQAFDGCMQMARDTDDPSDNSTIAQQMRQLTPNVCRGMANDWAAKMAPGTPPVGGTCQQILAEGNTAFAARQSIGTTQDKTVYQMLQKDHDAWKRHARSLWDWGNCRGTALADIGLWERN